MDAGFEASRAETRTLVTDFRAEIAIRFDRQTRQIVFAAIGALFTVAALAVGSVSLG